MMNLNDKFEAKLRCFMPLEGKSLCVALSGGADSVCLLHLLKGSAKNLKFSLSAAHINHCLRGEESDGDQTFCEALCKSLDIPLKVFEIKVKELSKNGESIEEAARRLRYNALRSVECDFIVTAHHSDDNIETVLINMLRGTGLKGLCGIPRQRNKIIRPLLDFSRKDILNYCEENRLEFVTDSSNNSDDYTRNLIRHKVVPILEKINPSLNAVFNRNIELLKRDEDFLNLTAKNKYKDCLEENKLICEVLKNEHEAIISRVVRLYCENNSGITPDAVHINEFVKIIRAGKGSYQFLKGYTAFVRKGRFFLENTQETYFSVKTLKIFSNDIINYLKVNNLLLKNAIDCDKICGELGLRTRIAGDMLKLNKKGVTKPLRRLQQEKGIPLFIRKNSPVAFDDLGALWCYGIGADVRVLVDSATKNAIIFNVTENKGKINNDT